MKAFAASWFVHHVCLVQSWRPAGDVTSVRRLSLFHTPTNEKLSV